MKDDLIIFESYGIRRLYDEKTEVWYFSVIDIISALTEQNDYQTARKYWNKLAERLKNEGSEVVTKCHWLKMRAADGKMRETDVADVETMLRLIQSVPSKKAEPIKLWLAKATEPFPVVANGSEAIYHDELLRRFRLLAMTSNLV